MPTNQNKPTEQNGNHGHAARYIGAMTTALADVARAEDCDILGYLLELATMAAKIPAGTPSERLPS